MPFAEIRGGEVVRVPQKEYRGRGESRVVRGGYAGISNVILSFCANHPTRVFRRLGHEMGEERMAGGEEEGGEEGFRDGDGGARREDLGRVGGGEDIEF